MSTKDARNYLDTVAHLIRKEIPDRALPAASNSERLFRIYAVLLGAIGENVTGRDVHNAWVAWTLDENPSHPALVPYEELPSHVAIEDDVYVAAIQRVAARLSETNRMISKEQ